ncbi:MAG: DNA polymerase III subunit gamma/tau [Planctomycetaceae bacterium]|nr:DNA polymerase III subunit gamma/tau [Planctomycetaceae bacterium]
MPPTIAQPEEVPAAGDSHRYVVVARRYRPQTFAELIGQEHVAQALSNAIASQRVGHAYLFTGARGVGKTSAARIFAKALNCEHGPTPVPCNECDICQSISTGEDVDVLEIDGASNRGIDEIRQLRQNAGVRPSRSRYKIYIIDEVHMLTREAFNALLKTLEEPPEHVKFIFCTTEATKIPITILSRCQRFDFAGILTRSIHQRLQQIVIAEGVEADAEALEVLARRAAGSMRDSQSLLEQLLAFSPGRITVADVHAMLGTAGEERLGSLLEHLIGRDPVGALADLDAAMNAGVDAGQLIEQLFGLLRDCMVAAAGCQPEAFLYTSPSAAKKVTEAGKRLGLSTLLAAMQILDQTLSRMRYSTQGRILAELALVRISHLEDLDELAGLIAQLQSDAGVATTAGVQPMAAIPPGSAAKKKYEPPVASQAPSSDPQVVSQPVAKISLSEQTAVDVWRAALDRIPGMVVDQARQFDSVTLAAPNRLVIRFKPGYAVFKSACERPEQVVRFERALAEVVGEPIRVSFALSENGPAKPETARTIVPPHQRLAEASKHPLVRQASELFGAQPVRVDEPRRDSAG